MSEKPLNEYIDLEAYDVVSGEQYRELQAWSAGLEAALREIRSSLTALATGGIEEITFAEEVQDALTALEPRAEA